MLRNDDWDIEPDALAKIEKAASQPCTCKDDSQRCVACVAKTYQLWVESRATILLKKLRNLYADTTKSKKPVTERAGKSV